MTPAILFDLDGTLIDSLPNVTDAANAVLSERGLPPLERKQTAGFVGLGEQVFMDRLIAATALDPLDRDAHMESFIGHYKVEALKTQLFPGAKDALNALKEKGFSLGLVTNKPRAPLLPTLETAGLSTVFDAVIAGDDLPKRKPYAEPIWHALKLIGAKTCVYVGDSPTDAETAQNAGVPFVLYTEGIRTVPVSAIPHDVVFDDFQELPEICARLAG